MIIAAYLSGDSIVVHRFLTPEAVEVLHIRPDDPRWMQAAEAAQHFAASAEPLPDLTE